MKKILLIVLLVLSSIQAQTIKPIVHVSDYLDIYTAVQFGRIPGAYTLDKYGENPLVDEDCACTIWEFGGEYIYDSDSTAPIKYLSSSSALDVGLIVSIQGLDSLGYLINQEITTNGQTNVLLNIPLWRVFRMQNESDFDNNLNGTLYCHTSATNTAGVPPDANVRAIIDNGNNQTLMALTTIPKGKVGLLFRGEIGAGLEGGNQTTSEYVRAEYLSRRFGKVFKTKKRLTLSNNGNSNYIDKRTFPDIIPDLTDIQLYVHEASTEMAVWGTLDLLVLDQEHFPEWQLEEIGQSEY